MLTEFTTLQNYVIHVVAVYFKTLLEKNVHCFNLVNIEIFDDHFCKYWRLFVVHIHIYVYAISKISLRWYQFMFQDDSRGPFT